MDWFYPKRRRGPEWKQSWTDKTFSSVSTPPLHLLLIFSIVFFFLWCSQYNEHKAQYHSTMVNLQLFLILLPILAIFLMVLYSSIKSFCFGNMGGSMNPRQRHESLHLQSGGGGGGGIPWGVALSVVLLLVLLSYQSSFQSNWFGLWRRSV